MTNSGDAAEQVVRLSVEGFEVAARLTGSAAKNIAILLASVLKQEATQANKTRGKARLTNMIKSGKELKVFSIPNKDLKKFTEQAKRYGVLYCVLRDKNTRGDNVPIDIIARAEDASKIQRIVERFELGKVDKSIRKGPEIYFLGNSISSTYLKHLMDVVGDRDFSINIISKSGTTTEPAIAFRIFKEKMETKYGKEEAAKRIYATTDKSKGALKKLSDEEGYQTFVVPDDVGGRFSVLTAVGLLPIAASGADIDKLMEGAASGRKAALELPFEENDAMKYAALRNIFLRKGKSVEILANYEPAVHYVSEWWKQLFGESEGKDQRGIFPASVDLTTDLHSMGQFIQDGSRIMFETVIEIEKSREEIVMNEEPVDLDGLNYLAGKTVDFINKSAMNGTILAHTDGQVPNLLVKVPEVNEFYLGQLFYFFEFACGVSGYLLGVNPFNQPGVESYKKNMFALLGKPGYEAQREELLKRL